jgi:hypothetical protein
MDGPNFDPRVNDKVYFENGLFKITNVVPCIDNYRTTGFYGWVDLEDPITGFKREHVPVALGSLKYVDDEVRTVRRVIEWLETSPNGRKYPDYIDDYEIETGNDHAGNPSIYVRFLVDPDYIFENGKASEEKVAALNAFLYDVRQTLLGLGLDRWTYVRAGQARKVLDVAS